MPGVTAKTCFPRIVTFGRGAEGGRKSSCLPAAKLPVAGSYRDITSRRRRVSREPLIVSVDCLFRRARSHLAPFLSRLDFLFKCTAKARTINVYSRVISNVLAVRRDEKRINQVTNDGSACRGGLASTLDAE